MAGQNRDPQEVKIGLFNTFAPGFILLFASTMAHAWFTVIGIDGVGYTDAAFYGVATLGIILVLLGFLKMIRGAGLNPFRAVFDALIWVATGFVAVVYPLAYSTTMVAQSYVSKIDVDTALWHYTDGDFGTPPASESDRERLKRYFVHTDMSMERYERLLEEALEDETGMNVWNDPPEQNAAPRRRWGPLWTTYRGRSSDDRADHVDIAPKHVPTQVREQKSDVGPNGEISQDLFEELYTAKEGEKIRRYLEEMEK